jgi:toxin-antitoxin system PIN domain toxin
MRCVDVNVLVDAHRPEARRHDAVRAWLDTARRGPEPLGVPRFVASGFLRVVTHARIFREPTPLPIAIEFVDALLASPAVTTLDPGDRHWPIFVGLCTDLDLRGNDLSDAFLAAIALEHGSTWVTSDLGFRRFPGLRTEAPGAASP